MRKRCLAGVMAIWAVAAATAATAAEITLVHTKTRESFGSTWLSEIVFRLTGEIRPGDADKVSRALDGVVPDDQLSALTAVSISLDSPGGSYAEGLKLMSLFYDKAIRTVVEGEASCLSACAIAFLGGRGINEASLGYTSRTVHPGGRLGFHAPSLGISTEAGAAPERLNAAYAVALQSIGALIDRAEAYDIRNSLLETIVSTPPDEMYILETVDDFVRWNIYVPFGQGGWEIDRETMARMCEHVPVWRDGGSVLARNARFTSNVGTDDWYPSVRLRELADGFVEATPPPGNTLRGRDTRYFHTQTIAFEFDEHCIVEIWPFTTQGGGEKLVVSLFYTNATPEAGLLAVRQSNIGGDSVSRFMSLPPDFEVARLPRVPYP